MLSGFCMIHFEDFYYPIYFPMNVYVCQTWLCQQLVLHQAKMAAIVCSTAPQRHQLKRLLVVCCR